jgi:hypothetical protein
MLAGKREIKTRGAEKLELVGVTQHKLRDSFL